VERAKGCQVMLEQGYDVYDISKGVARCPICLKRAAGENDSNWTFTQHIMGHSQQQRLPYIAELCRVLRAFDVDPVYSFSFRALFDEYEEAKSLYPN